MDEVRLTVSADHAGQRIDKWLSTRIEGITRQYVQRLLQDGRVLLDGAPLSHRAMKVKEGQLFTVSIPAPETLDVVPEPIPLDIVYEDEHLLVINKAAGMVVHPAAGVSSGTMVNALLYHCGDELSGIGGVARPGIVHRLDKDTSGLMLVAKHDAAHQHLSTQLQDRSLSRTYHAFCWSALQPPMGSIDAPIGRSPRDRKKMGIVAGGKPAVTHYRTIKVFSATTASGEIIPRIASLVECKLETGRTHQIRVHLTEQGCGLIGDPVYGMSTTRRLSGLTSLLTDDVQQGLRAFQRQALHAIHIRFIHPHSQQEVSYAAPYPVDIQQLDKCCQLF